jgi:hypothetical protein
MTEIASSRTSGYGDIKWNGKGFIRLNPSGLECLLKNIYIDYERAIH